MIESVETDGPVSIDYFFIYVAWQGIPQMVFSSCNKLRKVPRKKKLLCGFGESVYESSTIDAGGGG